MIFQELSIPGVFLITLEPFEDARGYFARSFCRQEFMKYGLVTDFVQCNMSYNRKKGTLRGMHRQLPPYAETKMVLCLRGAIYDVALDLRNDYETYGKWVAVKLCADKPQMLYIPKGMAHGFQSLENDTLIHYYVDEFYMPDYEDITKFNDPRFAIEWPIEEKIMSDKDSSHP